MPIYHYQLVADIEVQAPNIQAAERAVHQELHTSQRHVRGIGSYIGSVKLPSQRKHERLCRVEVAVSPGEINRVKKTC